MLAIPFPKRRDRTKVGFLRYAGGTGWTPALFVCSGGFDKRSEIDDLRTGRATSRETCCEYGKVGAKVRAEFVTGPTDTSAAGDGLVSAEPTFT